MKITSKLSLLEKSTFSKIGIFSEFFFHKAILGLDPRGCACAMDMVDGAFERGDVGLFKPGIDYAIGGKFITLRRKHFAGFCGFFEFKKKKTQIHT